MFCEKCGNQIPDDSKFCTNCGAVLNQDAPAAANAAAAAPAAVAVKAAPIKLTKKTMAIGAAVLVVIVAIIIAVSVVKSMPETVVLDDYIKVSFSGLDSRGEANLSFDFNNLIQDLGADDEKDYYEYYNAFRENLTIYLEKTTNLSNGEEIYINAEWVEDAFEELDLKLKLKEDTVTVSGLEKSTVLDLFEDLEITYSGYAPNASVSVNYVGSNEFIINNVYYYVNGGYDLSEGSVFTVEASVSEYTAAEQGYVIEVNSKEFTATNVPQPTVLDVFADLQVTFEGCAPYAKAKVEYVGDNEFIRDYITFYVRNGNNLSEGSVFTVEASYSEWSAQDQGYIIEVTTKEYTASNLPQPVELNVFDFVEVIFSGTEGYGKATYKVNTEDYFIRNLYYSFNKNTNLTGGETIALMFTVPSWLDPLQYGYTVSNTSKQYTVPTLGKEATSFNDLSAEGQAAVLAKLDELCKYYLTKESTDNGTNYMYLQGTGYDNGNQLYHAAAVENIKLHSVVTGGYTSWWSDYRYMVFVYTLDVVNHPNISDNNGCVSNACIYFYVEDPVANGDGTLEGNLENIEINSDVYLSYDAMCEDFLNNFTTKDVYTPGA